MDLSNGKTWLLRGVRWGLAGAGVFLACVIVSVHGVSAELSEQSLRLGRNLGAFQRFAGDETALLWNGQELSFHVRTVSEPVSQIVESFVHACGSDRNRTLDEMTSALQSRGATPPRNMARSLILRDVRDEAEGTGVCFAGLAEAGLSEAVERLGRFAVDLDVTELGPVRYVYARKIAAGTQLFLITAEGPLSLARLFPADGEDAEGSELIEGARPKSSVRSMSLRMVKSPYAINAYESTDSATQVLSDYAAQAQARGYEALDLEQLSEGVVSTPPAPAAAALRVLRNGDALLIATGLERASGSVMSVVKMPRPVAEPRPDVLAENQ